MVPTLALGIPGSATTAVILTGLIIHGVRPGPDLFREHQIFFMGFWSNVNCKHTFFYIWFFWCKNICKNYLGAQQNFMANDFYSFSVWDIFFKSINT